MSLQEVTVRIRFLSESLGSVRKSRCTEMLRDAQGRVLYMPTWWSALLRYAAKLLNRHQDDVDQVDWDPVVDGVPKLYRRYYEPGRFTPHEAFLRGDVVAVNCVIPSAIDLTDFRELLEIAGTYRGISPYKPEKKYGLFEVVDVRPRRRAERK